MNVPLEYSIVDNRKAKDFTTMTYSGYKKIDVTNQFEKSLLDNDLEASCNWFIELHISGQVDHIWKIIFYTLAKNINVYNPNLPSWTWLKYKRFSNIMNKFNKGFEYESRNNQEIRNLLTDVVVMIVYSNKSFNFNKLPKITNKDFSQESLTKKITSKELFNIKDITDDTCSKELKIGLNEIVNNLKYGRIEEIIYWYLWIEKIEKFKKKNNIPFITLTHKIKGISDKYDNDWRWSIWKIIIEQCHHLNDSKLSNEINAIYNMYKWKYSSSTRIKKQYLIFFAFLMLKENIQWNISIIDKYEYRIQACCNINQLYRLKKKEELAIENIDTSDEEYQEEEKIEYQKLNDTVNSKPSIEIKTQKKAKPHKFKENNNEQEKHEAIMQEKLNHFNHLLLYKTDKHHHKKHHHSEYHSEHHNENIYENEYKNIKY